MLHRVDLHQQHIGAGRLVDQGVERGVAGKAAIPVVLALHLHRFVQLRQAGRGHDGIGQMRWAVKMSPWPVRTLVAQTKILGMPAKPAARVQLLKIDGALQQHAQGVDVQRIGLVRERNWLIMPSNGLLAMLAVTPHPSCPPLPQLAQSRARAFAGRFVAGFGMVGKLQRSAGKSVG